MPFVEVEPEVDLFAEDWGEGKPIVLVHGWPFSHRIFEHQMIGLAERGYRVVGIDLRGFGLSDKPWQGNDYDTWAGDVGRVLEALDLRDVLLAGWSTGGAICAHYVGTRHDPRVSELVLMAAPVPSAVARPDNPDGLLPRAMETFIHSYLDDPAEFVREFTFSGLNHPASPEWVAWLAGLGNMASMRAARRGLEEMRDRDVRPAMEAIRIPTRIYHGPHDKVVPFHLGELQARSIPGAKLVRFENSGHALFHDEKDKLVDELDNFANAALQPMVRAA